MLPSHLPYLLHTFDPCSLPTHTIYHFVSHTVATLRLVCSVGTHLGRATCTHTHTLLLHAVYAPPTPRTAFTRGTYHYTHTRFTFTHTHYLVALPQVHTNTALLLFICRFPCHTFCTFPPSIRLALPTLLLPIATYTVPLVLCTSFAFVGRLRSLATRLFTHTFDRFLPLPFSGITSLGPVPQCWTVAFFLVLTPDTCHSHTLVVYALYIPHTHTGPTTRPFHTFDIWCTVTPHSTPLHTYFTCLQLALLDTVVTFEHGFAAHYRFFRVLNNILKQTPHAYLRHAWALWDPLGPTPAFPHIPIFTTPHPTPHHSGLH